MRRFSAIILLAGIFAMNMDMLCQSVCLAGHDGMADIHTSHKMGQHKMANHEMPAKDFCPITHESHHNMSHASAQNTLPPASLKCDCSTDHEASLGYELTLAVPASNPTPNLQNISKIETNKPIFLSNTPTLLENPPETLS